MYIFCLTTEKINHLINYCYLKIRSLYKGINKSIRKCIYRAIQHNYWYELKEALCDLLARSVAAAAHIRLFFAAAQHNKQTYGHIYIFCVVRMGGMQMCIVCTARATNEHYRALAVPIDW